MLISLKTVREFMQKEEISALIIPTGDPHASEYPCPHWELRKALCPFTGSAGTLVITAEEALLWTDSRYWVQAARELATSEFTLMRAGDAEVPRPETWIATHFNSQTRIGIDGAATTLFRFEEIEKALYAKEITLTDVSRTLYTLWENRPPMPEVPVLPFTLSQDPRTEKLSSLREALKKVGADAMLVTALDDLAWVTNLRGGDVPFTPVFLGALLLDQSSATLFINPKKVGRATYASLQADGIRCRPYEALQDALRELPNTLRLLVDAKQMNAHLYAGSLSHVNSVRAASPISALKTRKNPREIQSIREAMEKEGAALAKLFFWVEESLKMGKTITEFDVAEKHLALRKEAENFVELSFETIAATGPNAALPHYAPRALKSSMLQAGTLLLLDCGGQYFGATTDITRTVALGSVSEEIKRDYTAVLRAHIALLMARFPAGLPAFYLDSVARGPLWEEGMDFGHSTGHGVGFFLCVHEAPLAISPRTNSEEAARLQPGVVVSDEPGVYRTGKWGIRIENLITPIPSEKQGFLEFEPLSLFPYDRSLIDLSMLSPKERAWIDGYHAYVLERLKNSLEGPVLNWLERATAPL